MNILDKGKEFVQEAAATADWLKNQFFFRRQLQQALNLKPGTFPRAELLLIPAAGVVATTSGCDVGEDIEGWGCDHTGSPDVTLDDGDAVLEFLQPGSIHVPITFTLTGAECPDEQFQLYGKLIVRDSSGNIFYETNKQQQTVTFSGQPVDTEFQFTGVPPCGGGSFSGELQLTATGAGGVHLDKSLTFTIQ